MAAWAKQRNSQTLYLKRQTTSCIDNSCGFIISTYNNGIRKQSKFYHISSSINVSQIFSDLLIFLASLSSDMDIERSEHDTPQDAVKNLTLKEHRQKQKHSEKSRQIGALHIHITPQQYRGMHFLGNFKQTLSWNSGQEAELRDNRLALLPSSLFVNRAVLDVGSGEGKLPIQIAMRFFPKQIVALDIDAKLLQRASKLVDKIVSRNQLYQNRQEIVLKRVKELPLYFQQQYQKNHDKIPQRIPKVEIAIEAASFDNSFPDNFCICNDNFMNIKEGKRYDTILIMRTSKWVHLALGDKGLVAMFEKVYDLLNQKGILVLEYPLYRSYQKKKNMNGLYMQNIKDNINIDPLTFPSLLAHMGFDLVEELMSQNQRALKHPLSVFRKKGLEESIS